MNKSIDKLLKADDLSKITTYQAGIMQASSHRNLQKHCDQILKPYGISKMQWLIIGTVFESGDKGIRLTDLAKKLDTTLSYLTTTINLLVSRGVLIRNDNETDNRSKFVCLSPSFALKCDEIEKTLRQELRRSIYSNVAPADFRTYMRVLHQLSQVC